MAYDAGQGGNPFGGQPHRRIDGAAKVTGAARYGSDEPVANPAYAYLVTSSIARGRVAGFGLAEARAVAGFIDILTHESLAGEYRTPPPFGGHDGQTTTLESDQVWHDGQIVGVVLAESFEAAREAAHKVVVRYTAETPSATFDSAGVSVEPHKSPMGAEDPRKGDAAGAFATAPVKIDARYSTPAQHHNPIELFATTCVWEGPKLTVYEASQFMWGMKNALAKQLAMDPDNVRVVSRFVGGAFGSKGATRPQTALCAIAARRLNRPVKLVVTRDQGFTTATFRAETRQHVQLGAAPDGRLVSFSHEGWEVTSRPSGYNVAGVDTTARMYACPNITTAVSVVHADRNTPGFQRAPAETPYMFGLECAMDELAYALAMDPIELRRVNDTQVDPVSGLRFSSRSLMACFDQAAERFGWKARNPKPGSMRDGDWLIGWGCAASCYPTNIGPGAARLSLTPDGKATIDLAAHEIGTGAYTTVAIATARGLGLPVEAVTVRMGDSDLPPIPVAGGSNNAASTAHVAHKACAEVLARIAAAAVAATDSPFHGVDPKTLTLENGALIGPGNKSEPLQRAVGRLGGRLEVYAENIPEGVQPEAMAGLYKGQLAMARGSGRKDVTAYAFGAQFVEVRVHARTREMRAPRIVSAFAAGNIINP
ncbi:MAG: xanthine dehydrogenase family protein molybdopterin-binding subunit, partial [Caulobacteraceae bacterium]|nr:xanthine dehydrogenase family protein molybdopterin-binding subunit [Caulobacteraceae bacterium]